MERVRRLEAAIARQMNVRPGGTNYNSMTVAGFDVTAIHGGEGPAQVFIKECATGAARKDN
jgi:hypothetical protein